MTTNEIFNRREEAIAWWFGLPEYKRKFYADKAYDLPAAQWLNGRLIELLWAKLSLAEKQVKDGDVPSYCPECSSDLEYQFDVDDYNQYYDKCPVCGWNNAQLNHSLL